MTTTMTRILVAALAFGLAGCAAESGGEGSHQTVKTAEAGGKTVTLSTTSGRLTNGENTFTLAFTDATGQPATVESPTVRFTMPAEPNMAEMNADATLTPARSVGVYQGAVKLGMKGPWQTVVAFKDPAGQHRATFTIQAE